MSEECNKKVPQIAVTAYESNEEDIEVTNLFNAKNKKYNIKIHEPRSISPSPIKHKSKIVLKSPITTSVQRSTLSPGLSDLNNLTDVEIMSDSDDEKCFIRSPNLTPGPIDYVILTDVEDLSEDEEHEKKNACNEEHTDIENFTYDKGIVNEIEETEQPFETLSYFPPPHKEVIFHSKDGTVKELSPTDELNPIWLKTTNEEIKGYESEEEIITAEEFKESKLPLKNYNTYYHDIDVGVVKSVETIKHERCKHKNRNHVLPTKKIVMSEIECGKKQFRNKNRCNSETHENSEKRSQENKTKVLSKYMTEPVLSKVTTLAQNQNNKINQIKHQENNNTFVIHDNLNDFSISIHFENHNSVLLNVGRDYGNLSMKWFNNGITAGRIISDYNNLNILEPLEPGYFIKSSLYDPKQQFEVDLFMYGTVKTLQNTYFTCIAVYTVVQPINIAQLYVNKLFQTQISLVKNSLVKVCSLKDRITNMENVYLSPVTRLSAFKIFNRKKTEKYKEPTKINFETEKHVPDVINFFESICGSPKLVRKFNLKRLSNSETTSKKYDLNKKSNCIYINKKSQIGNYLTKILSNDRIGDGL